MPLQIFLAFSTAFFGRIFCSVTRAPSFLIHAHLVIIPLFFGVVLFKTYFNARKKIAATWLLLVGLLLLFLVIIASTVLNNAGLINAILLFLMLGEPFMLLAAMVCVPMSLLNLKRFQSWLIGACFANMALAFIQYLLLESGRIYAGGLDGTDGMAGVFFVSGAGNYVSTTVSLFFSFYYFMFVRESPLWLRSATVFFAFFQLKLSDSKQVLATLMIAAVIGIFTHIKDIKKTLLYLFASVIIGSGFNWCVYNLEGFEAFKNYATKDVYGPDGLAVQTKFAAFRIIPTYYQSFLNELLGLGPGHTVGRLGGWLIQENWKILGPLGATVHPASAAVLEVNRNSWIAQESTMYCALFGWAGIWGDLGYLGVASYLFLWFLVWHYFCLDYFSKFLVLSTLVFGLIFTQMEEPGYTLYAVVLIGLRRLEFQFSSLEHQEYKAVS
ncbi:Oligosaccharide repeat unit polymerase [Tumidithrix helvetica PCC 7403]|uniref:hypothetical protein n=1 Tax=Tumidithrix helvetica TaxID=3457545 RepID=UPI003CB599EF